MDFFAAPWYMRRVHEDSVDKSCTICVRWKKDREIREIVLRCWSAPGDHARIGTLARTLSRVEFQPQWLRKPPAAGWFRIFV
jgi:hypothetical protein